ncbi:unnamed protein product [Alternaria alternata]
MSNSPDAIDLLLKYGVDANVKDATGRSPLHYAVQADSSILIEKLLKAGARPDAVDVFQKTPLMAAAEFGAIHAASTLLKHGANLAADGDTVLIESAIGSGPDFIQVCVKAGAQLELTRKNGDTALLAACRVGQLPSVAYLVRQGAKLEYKHRGRSLNAHAAACQHPEVIKWLLVKRWTEQGKLGSEPADSGERVQCQPWSGVRTVKIPLRGDYERPKGSSLLDHTIYLHSVAKGGWRVLVPLRWDTVANLVPLLGEK